MPINIVVVSGRLVNDVEYKEVQRTDDVMRVANFTVAVDTGYGDYERTHFIDAKTFGSSAKFMHQYCVKGDLVELQGELNQEKWDSSNGEKRSRIVINARRVELLRKKGDKKQPGNEAGPPMDGGEPIPDELGDMDFDNQHPFNV